MAFWNASEMRERDRFPYWREVLCEAYTALSPTIEGDGSFTGRVNASLIDGINVTTISSCRQKVHRRREDISRTPHEVYFLNLQVSGNCRMIQNGREAILSPGEFALVDSTEPYLNDYVSQDWTQFSFRIPRSLLRPHLRNAQSATAITLTNVSPAAAIAIGFLESVARNADRPQAGGLPIANSIVDLVAMALGASAPEEDRARTTLRSCLSQDIVRFVATHASDPDLTPTKAAQHFRISVRYVHRLLEESGETFSKLLLRTRLERCAQDLRSNPILSIGEVAFRWGFNDLSHFSRTFKNHFGVTPRDLRSH